VHVYQDSLQNAPLCNPDILRCRMPRIFSNSNCLRCGGIMCVSDSLKTRKDVGTSTKCLHDMWPSVQLASVSGAKSELGLLCSQCLSCP